MTPYFFFARADAKRCGAPRAFRAGVALIVGMLGILGLSGRAVAQTWTSQDIGTATTGATTVSGNAVALSGSGRDIWNTADGFRFYYINTDEDFDLVVRVRSLQHTDGWAKAGLMARWSLEANAKHSWICVSAAHGTAYQERASPGAESTSSAPTEDGTAPRWLRLTRTTGYMSAWLTGYTSADGVNWIEAGRTFSSYRTPLYVGLAVTSHNDGVLCRAEFDNVQLTLPPAAPSGFRQVHAGPDGLIELEWTDNSTDETGFVIQLQPGYRGGSPSTIGTVGANVTRFTTRRTEVDAFRLFVQSAKNDVKSTSASTDGWITLAPVMSTRGITESSITVQFQEPNMRRIGQGRGPWSVERSTDNASFVVVANEVYATDGYYGIYHDTNVVRGTTYYYRVRYLDQWGNSSGYARLPGGLQVEAPLPAPSALTASVVSGSRVDLQWRDNSTDETIFDIYRATGTGASSWLAVVGANVTSYSDTTVAPTTTYRYRVQARRNGFSSASSNEATVTTPSGGTPPPTLAGPTGLTAVAVAARQIDLAWNDNSADETGFRIDRSTDTVNFTTVGTTTANVRTWSDTTVSPEQTYHYRVVALRNSEVSSSSNLATATTTGFGEWQSQDVGDVAVAGSASETGGVVTLRGSGADIWNTADEFRFRYVAWNGDGEITARVDDLTNTNGWAKAGVMFRETLTGPSRHAWMCVSVAHGSAFQHRATTGGDSLTSAPTESGGFRQWVRVVRSGNTFRGYVSADGATWNEAGSVTLALPTTLYVGVAVTSHNDGVLCTATFGNVTVRGAGPPPSSPPLAPTTLAATARAASQIDLTWSDAANNESGFEVEAAAGNGAFAQVATLGSNVTSFSHAGLTASTIYAYRVRAVNAAGASGYSNTATAMTPAAPPPDSGTWSSQDVGSVAAAGSASEASGVVTVRGSGTDIWNTADGFHYRYRTWTGDGTIVARVTSLTNTNGWAKAGLMFRESLTGPSRHVWMCVSSAHGTALQQRAAAGGDSATSAPTEAGGVPRWLRLTRSGNTFTGAESVDGVNWTPASTITLALPATVYLGLAVTSHNDGVLCTATFSDVSIGGSTTPPPTEPPPSSTSWAFADIGAVGLAGSNSSSGNTITVRGSGDDIWGRADAFRFVYRQVTGDGLVEARVDSMTFTHGWAKAGVMIRETLGADARNVFAAVTPSHQGIVSQARATSDGETTNVAGPGRNAPSWLQVRRTGNTFTAAWSADGVTWTTFATHTVAMGATAYFGFAVTSHDNAQLNTAVFSDPFVE